MKKPINQSLAQNFTITFGALARPLRLQLREQGFRMTTSEANAFQRRADSIDVLRIGGLLSDAKVHTARKKLVQQIATFIRKKS